MSRSRFPRYLGALLVLAALALALWLMRQEPQLKLTQAPACEPTLCPDGSGAHSPL
ncbi:hypothetical protein [Roseateles toxinivorans]|uniref:Uncharacterized protein n=1 Tax=Roseateles toxinivorans TaxID=270368 RepID=A0A4R6QKV7_9BURK|nr:hypothetical protein [Roseateles toxinivorans]TDP63199.1 hypothetical protein DES47_105201 [Roseateles toxinivorans]